ncbi:MAG TPA: WD40 repeat domain-containing protein, partial [Cyanobacteria bacterium UBA11368]|nr:WD40 repeat domain-containing protein [Cyanobacteria bacterium UBA11368]
HNNVVNAVAVNPDGRTLASAGRDGVRLWDIRTGQQIGAIPGYSDWVQTLAFSPDGQLLATGGYDGTIRIWQAVY